MKDQKRGKNVALVGAVLQATVTIVAVIIWQLTGSKTVLTGIWFLLGGLPLWGLTMLLFYARQLAEQENIELETITAAAGAETIFSEGGEMQLRPAQSRVILLEKWVVPLFTLLFAAYQAALVIVMFRHLRNFDMVQAAFEVTSRAPGAVFLIISGFAAFLFSRYATGMSSRREWSLLRATGSYTLIVSIFLWAGALSVGLASKDNEFIDIVIAYILLLVQLIFAIELLMYFVFDIYRPRVYGEEYRPSYDSRVFALLAEPSRVGHSIADTINYQFGFEVSSTWFYRLVSKAFVPLIIFGVIVIFLLSSIVIVNEGEVYVVKTFGRLEGGDSVLKPGIHLKYPWPISTAERFDTGVTHEIVLGVGKGQVPKRTKEGRELIVWSEEHGFGARQEKDFLIAVAPREKSPQELAAEDETKAPTPSVNIIKLVVVLRYRVIDPYKYGYKYTNSRSVMDSVAREAMVQYCASATLDRRVGDDPSRPQGLMSFGRVAAADELQKIIAQRLGPDGLDIGVEVEYLGIASAHPPAAAVPEYEKVLESERLQDKQRFEAEAKASKILADVSGDPAQALQLYLALHRMEIFGELENKKDNPEKFESHANSVEKEAQGQIASLEKEIASEMLLGRKPQDVADRKNLIKSYKSFIAKLTEAKKGRVEFDYDSEIAASQKVVNVLFSSLSGSPAEIIAQAEASRWKKQLTAESELMTYRAKLQPYKACKSMYMFDQYMDVLEETLPGKDKKILGFDSSKAQIRLNLESQGGGLESVLDAGSDK
ncbi:MAG: hypothetical protein KAR11_07310 [Phycisphaerae bacterium]|nr:hypothetical protein [Phycisphaerae bacterium]